eukprot:2319145-Rhodomonas_salina.1
MLVGVARLATVRASDAAPTNAVPSLALHHAACYYHSHQTHRAYGPQTTDASCPWRAVSSSSA